MRRELGFAIAAVVLLGLLISGCSKSVMGPESQIDNQDLSQLQQLIKEDPLFSGNTETLNDGEPVQFNVQSGNTIAAKIYPRAWGRRIISTTLDTKYETVNDTTVVATVTNTIQGEVIILAKSSATDTTTTKVVKPFTEVTTHKLKFYRLSAIGNPRHWRPAEISATKGGTVGSQVTINKVEVSIGDKSYTITDPNEHFIKVRFPGDHRIPPLVLTPKVLVRVTLTSSDPDTDWVSIHRPSIITLLSWPEMPRLGKPLHLKMKLISQTQIGSAFERVYEDTWAGSIFDHYTFFIDALTKGSLFDDTAPFSTQLWGIPYIVQ
ncbi:MAG: hypothetical protein HY088_03295 [Ignavibacteriales bacterium]|nr:hypothetical protein [Ignavibacteriales bacterium]